MTKIIFLLIYLISSFQQFLKNTNSKLSNKYIKNSLENPEKLKTYKHLLLPVLKREELTIGVINYLTEKNIAPPDSFCSLIKLNKYKYNAHRRIEWKLNHKITGSKFASYFGFQIPEMYQINVPFKEIKFKNNMVLKPVSSSGSNGAYIYHNNEKIWDIKNEQEIKGVYSLKKDVKRLLSTNSFDDNWITEKYINSSNDYPKRDFKFYTFYGKVAMIQETEVIPEIRYCYWNRKLELLKDVHTHDSKTFPGDALDPNIIYRVEALSLEIPVPFIRIDFLQDNKQFFFNEFTPSPGSYNKFNREIDRMLGEEYIAAESRLYEDQLNLKPFDFVTDFLKQI